MINEETIVRQMKEGNQLAFTLLFNEYSKQVYSLSFKYLYNRDLAEDVVQNVFFKIWERRKEIDESRPFNRYLFTILKNDLLNVLRDRTKEIFSISENLNLLNSLADEVEEPELDEEQLRLVRKAIEQLSPQKRKIVELKISGEYSNQEIADKLNLSINTIKFQYSQALKELRTIIRIYSFLLLLWTGL
ncbi:RNA polymerase sigma factor [Bacteroides sp.]